MLIQHSFTNLGASPPQNESESASPQSYTHRTALPTIPCPTDPPKTNPKNLGTFAPILEVRTLIAKAIWGNIVDVSCLRKRNKNSWSIKYLSYLRNKVSENLAIPTTNDWLPGCPWQSHCTSRRVSLLPQPFELYTLQNEAGVWTWDSEINHEQSHSGITMSSSENKNICTS